MRPSCRSGSSPQRSNAVSLRDLLVLAGDYPLPITPGIVAGCEGAGEVVATGPGAVRVRVGDRVMPTVFPDWIDGPFGLERAAQLGGTRNGTLAEYAVVPEEALVPIPEHLSYEEAAALPLTAVTAWHALTGSRPPLPGQTVVALGSGGVSLAVIQLAALAGARVIVTTSDVAKAERLRALGAHEVIDRRARPRWHEAVRELTDGRGADLVVDVAGTLEESLRSVAIGGDVAFVGYRTSATAAPRTALDARVLFASGARVRGIAVGSRAQFTALTQALATGRTQPVLGRVFPFTEAVAALRHQERGDGFGKVILTHA
ncbi:zinc-dependent alcohol dehydrogenase family protein [Streptomyces litchfieldiae]|uniref:NAD(P)-dependent alcohol dehydrogenase n=1 Tax=Streptomyces litchfieldiae TaxID=3075543 RepID=A0ABU2MRP8_9ACTN|nr:NAD(P)-dependent alcohol dehydrogenase [Streptomyces sp. DSM 44938]MDT0344276.1 NAD(P)-dependent alcohol dehydrogenase [Streptomyces sp. DSM 44938]